MAASLVGGGLAADANPFNQYNTELVKCDATNATMLANGDLVGRPRGERDGDAAKRQLAVESGADESAADQLDDDLFTPNYGLIQHLIPVDSVNNKSFTDVTFIVGPPQHSKKYVGHRVLLAMTSPVFETMFYGDMADKSKYIRIADVAPIGFENLLRYAYTDSLNLNSVEDAMLTAYAAKKYLLPQLLRECLTYIEHNIGPSTACVVFEFAHVLNSQQLVLQAMNLIDRQTLNVITNKSFNHVQAATVEFVANRKYLSLSSEFALFGAVVGWAAAEARRRDLDPADWSLIRSILSDNCTILGAIRFLALTQEEFARAVARTSSTIQVEASPAAAAGVSPDQRVNNGADSTAAPPAAAVAQTSSEHGQQHRRLLVDKVNPDDPNSLLSDAEQRAIFLNLALGDAARLPASINPATEARRAPPEYFTLRRFRASAKANLAVTTTTIRSIKSVTSKFQALSENVFIVGLTIPIRLDASSFADRTPKFECHLKFTTRTTSLTNSAAGGGAGGAPTLDHDQDGLSRNPASTLMMDTIDESLHISIARDKDCLVRLKRPILIRMGNMNELTLTFQTYALDEDMVALRTPKARSANFSEQTDGENISWLFFKSSGTEFSELHYYY